MRHFLEILEIKHLRGKEVLWESKNILNNFHVEGEFFMLSALFNTTGDAVIPSFYYLGLDNRTSIQITDTLDTLIGEPSGYGYSRQSVSSSAGFSIESYTNDNDEDHWRAKTQIITFSASGGQWGPVNKVFLTNTTDSTGYLISTAELPSSRTVLNGESITLRFALKLEDQS